MRLPKTLVIIQKSLATLMILISVTACTQAEGPRLIIVCTTPVTPLPPMSPTPTPILPSLALEDIFEHGPTLADDLDPQRLRTLIATGDVIPARYVDIQIRAHNNDFLYPFAETASVLRDADIALINLESSLISYCPPHREGFVFCGQQGFVGGLEYAGVDIVGLENNHIRDYGASAVASTQEALKQHGIDYADRNTLAIRVVNGLRFGFLAFNGVGERIDRQDMTAAIQQADSQTDVLVVSFHWGKEYSSLPQADPWLAPDDPVEIAHLAVDAGADLIIGNHPHWVQAVELYREKLIAYAHGNFIFDQMWSPEVRRGVVGRYTFYDQHLVKAEYLPVLIEDYWQPRFLAGNEAQAILNTMYQASRTLEASLQNDSTSN